MSCFLNFILIVLGIFILVKIFKIGMKYQEINNILRKNKADVDFLDEIIKELKRKENE